MDPEMQAAFDNLKRAHMEADQMENMAPDSHGHVWIPYKQHMGLRVEVCWRCRCLKIHSRYNVQYKYGLSPFGKKNPPSPCVKHRKSECPI